MRNCVRAIFYDFNAPMEGAVNHLYVDVKGLVSIGVGQLVDPIANAMCLPLKRQDGTLAAPNEIVADWTAVKTGHDFPRLGYRAAAAVVKLRLDSNDLRQLLEAKLSQNDAALRKRFLEFEDWPADAQLATHSLAWACGSMFRFPKLEAALRAVDFRTAAHECFMPEEKTISGLRPRNIANRILYTNAAAVIERSLDPDVLHWPHNLDAEPRPDQLEPPAPIVHATLDWSTPSSDDDA